MPWLGSWGLHTADKRMGLRSPGTLSTFSRPRTEDVEWVQSGQRDSLPVATLNASFVSNSDHSPQLGDEAGDRKHSRN